MMVKLKTPLLIPFAVLATLQLASLGFAIKCYQRTACCGMAERECNGIPLPNGMFAMADACVTVDYKSKQSERFCMNLAIGPNDFLWPEIEGITLTKDGCREITEEENAARPGDEINRICTCSTDGCDPLQNSGQTTTTIAPGDRLCDDEIPANYNNAGNERKTDCPRDPQSICVVPKIGENATVEFECIAGEWIIHFAQCTNSTGKTCDAERTRSPGTSYSDCIKACNDEENCKFVFYKPDSAPDRSCSWYSECENLKDTKSSVGSIYSKDGNCTVDCSWDQWNAWESCSVSCGGGTQMRTRNCTCSDGTDGGDQCSTNGSTGKKSRSCNRKSCPKCKNKSKKLCKENKANCDDEKTKEKCPITCDVCCGNIWSNKKCQKEKNECGKKKVKANCKKTCGLCEA